MAALDVVNIMAIDSMIVNYQTQCLIQNGHI